MSTELALASLRVWAIEVDLGGKTYRVPPLPAADWFLAVLSGETGPVVPGMLDPTDEEEIIERLVAGELTAKDITTANRDALAAASGWKWWEAERLMVSAAHGWKMIGGLLAGAGVDLSRDGLGKVLGTMYALAVTHMKPEDRFAFDSQIQAPPIGYADTKEWFDESAYADVFADMLREHQRVSHLPGTATPQPEASAS